jgi:hypothetical protein
MLHFDRNNGKARSLRSRRDALKRSPTTACRELALNDILDLFVVWHAVTPAETACSGCSLTIK